MALISPLDRRDTSAEVKRDPAQIQVLVIDDEPGLREMLVFGLKDRGYGVVAARDGEEGLEYIRNQSFNLVVLDILMPGIGGVDVLRHIRNIQPGIEVIMATGYATLETAVESMKLGAFDYISKPFGLDQLCTIFEKALASKRPHRLTE